jgi:hypothetical protein
VTQSQSSPGHAASSATVVSGGHLAASFTVNIDRVLIAAIFGALVIKFALITRFNIHWDEFYFLELTHQYVQGGLAGRFQTFHVHLFSWLPALGWDEIDQIVAGRFVMQALAGGSAFLIYAIARKFVTRSGALFALVAYLSFSAVVDNGAGFRVDPIATFLSLLSLWVVLCKPAGYGGAAIAGAAMALAALVTVKSAFYLVVLAGVFWCVAPSLIARAKLCFVFAICFAFALGGLFLFHSATLAPQEAVGAGAFLSSSASKVFLDAVFPRAFDLIMMVIPNPLFWIMLVEGAVVVWSIARKPGQRDGWRSFLPLVLALPVLTPIFYRNAYPYFYPFMIASAAILVGVSFDKHRHALSRPNSIPPAKLIAALVVIQCVILAFCSLSKLPDDTLVQRQVITVVRTMFPKPVHYIDGFGVIAGYPRSGFFMSTWGVDNYRRAGKPIFADLVARDQPPIVLADSPALYEALVPGVMIPEERRLLPEDGRSLRENYIRHWGMLFVAGKRLRRAADASLTFSISIGGEYRFEAAAPATIDGSKIGSGDVVGLSVGSHTIEFSDGAGEATLRWAQASRVPDLPPANPLTFFQRTTWVVLVFQMIRPDGSK